MSLENKPRKWTKQTNFNNPTMNSMNILSTFNPQLSKIYDNPSKYYGYKKSEQSTPSRKWIHIKNYQDSLNQNIIRYNTIEMKANKQHQNQSNKNEQSNIRNQKVWLSKSLMDHQINNLTGQKQKQMYKYINGHNSRSIRNKQLHGFNIISNI